MTALHMKLKELREYMRRSDALSKRMKKLVNKYLKEEYEFETIMFGFPPLIVESRDELWGRICEMADILNIGKMGFKHPETGRNVELIFSGPMPGNLTKQMGEKKNGK